MAVADWLHLRSNMRESGHPVWASPPVLPVAAHLTLHSSPLHPPHTPLVSHVHVGLMRGVFEDPRLMGYIHPLSGHIPWSSGEKERAAMSSWLGSFCLGPAARKLVLQGMGTYLEFLP